MERIVTSMLALLRATLVEVYVESGPMAVHAEKLGCPETTVARRLGRAHLFIADHLTEAAQRDREEQLRIDAGSSPRAIEAGPSDQRSASRALPAAANLETMRRTAAEVALDTTDAGWSLL
jgi:hypothetical protein